MKINKIDQSFLLSTLIASLSTLLPERATAQTFTTLHAFGAGTGSFPDVINIDGAHPFGQMFLSGNTLYGSAIVGGSSANGAIFKINTDGSGFTDLYYFTGGNDGAHPEGGLILSGNRLYGAADEGGTSDSGTVFAMNTNGTGFTNLHSFVLGSDGADPVGGLILSGNTLYGTTIRGGGGEAAGTVFTVNTDGTGFAKLNGLFVGNDAANPEAGLILSGNTLYGTAYQGGSSAQGAVFALNTDGTGFTNLHDFPVAPFGTNRDGAQPHASLILSGNRLYGTAEQGGSGGSGTVFVVNMNGTGFTTLHSFMASSNTFPSIVNQDGANPEAGLILSDNTLYGTAANGGSSGFGTIYALSTDGTSFTTLYTFMANSTNSSGDYTNSAGVNPKCALTLSGNTLYGTTEFGGANGNGTLFGLVPDFVQITVTPNIGPAPLTVNFVSPGVDSLGNIITNWNWQFGDGGTSTLQNPSHTFNTPGNYSGSLLTTKSNGVLVPATELFIAVSQPTVQFTANPTNGRIPLTVQFSSPGIDSGGSVISRWNWAFGDGATSTAQNPSHVYTNFNVGKFHPSLIVTNNLGFTVISSGPSITAPVNAGLVVNGGFETADFFGWTTSGDISFTLVDDGSQPYEIAPDSGTYLADLGTTGFLGYLSQTLATTVGATYILSCRLNSPDGLSPNEFLVSWNGNILFDQTDLPDIGWTNFQYLVAATRTSTVLQFGFRDDITYLGLDDISVVPSQLTISASGTNVILTWPTNAVGFTLQSTTNLVSAGAWSNVSPSMFIVNGQNAVTNLISGTQKFYRLSQ